MNTIKPLTALLHICLLILFACQQQQKPEQLSEEPLDLQMRIAFCSPQLSDKEWYLSENKAPLLEGLQVLDYPITTNNSLVQDYFNQGLILAFGFNHAEAARSFYYATKLDSTCAMAYWGFAYVLGPNYNAGMEPDNYQRAFDAIQKAQTLITDKTTQVEVDLIKALSVRYVQNPPDDRFHLDQAYADALAELFVKYPDDPNMGTLYVEALMDLHPWDIWDKQGKAHEWTPQILKVFDDIFSIDPVHPGAHHFYIHAVEASSTPELGLKSAHLYDEDLVPGAGHLVHMPTHIYIRTGDYHKGTLANMRSVEVDSSYLSSCHAQGTYPLTLYPHNYHFMSATATLEGNSDIAIMAAQKVADHANRQLMTEPGWGTIQHYYSIPYFVNVKLGKWEEILEMENKDVSIKYPDAVRHYARGMAFLGLKDINNAKTELESLQRFANDDSLKQVTIWGFNSTHDLLEIAVRVLEAEILSDEEKYDKAITLLKEAVELEDALMYQEPPDWFFSVRHHLGAVQIYAGLYQDAVQTFQDHLDKLPKNGWALHGLKAAYSGLSDTRAEEQVDKQLQSIWAYADISLESSVMK